MSAPRILNLDELTDESAQLVIRLAGQDHKAVSMTVESYIERVKRSRNIAEDAPLEDRIADTIGLLLEQFPTMNAEQLRKLPLAHLGKMVAFSLAAPDDLPQPDAAAPAVEGNA